MIGLLIIIFVIVCFGSYMIRDLKRIMRTQELSNTLVEAVVDETSKNYVGFSSDGTSSYIYLEMGNNQIPFLVDSGADMCFIDPSVVKSLEKELNTKFERSEGEYGGIGTKEVGEMIKTEGVLIPFTFYGREVQYPFYLFDCKQLNDIRVGFSHIEACGVIGIDLIKEMGWTIDFERQIIYFNGN